MKSPVLDPIEQRLAAALTTEADRTSPSADALTLIRARTAADATAPQLETLVTETAKPAGALQVVDLELARRRRRTVHGAVAVLLVAAATVAVVVGGIRLVGTPQPARDPAPASTFTARPSSGLPYAFTLYRVSDDNRTLVTEEVAARRPYAAAQGLNDLCSVAPVVPGVRTALDGCRVGSVTKGDGRVDVELVAVDATVVPSGSVTERERAAGVWAQAWVRTVQDTYDTEDPVRFTLDGRPFTLFGAIDTTEPIARSSAKATAGKAIFSPRADTSVTSPVGLIARTDATSVRWKVTDAVTGVEVVQTALTDARSQAKPGSANVDLAPGRYVATAVQVDDDDRETRFGSVPFTVVAITRPEAAPPVTDPVVTPVPLAAVYRARSADSALIAQWLPRPADATSLLQARYVPAPEEDHVDAEPMTGAEVASVTQTADAVVVDFASLGANRTVSAAEARLQLQSVAQTVNGWFGSRLPLRITLDGEPTELFGRIDTTTPVALGSTAVYRETHISAPVDGQTSGSAVTFIGTLAQPSDEGFWFITSDATDDVLYQGRIPIAGPTDPTYGFALDLPPGGYRMELNDRSTTGDKTSMIDVTTFTVR